MRIALGRAGIRPSRKRRDLGVGQPPIVQKFIAARIGGQSANQGGIFRLRTASRIAFAHGRAS